MKQTYFVFAAVAGAALAASSADCATRYTQGAKRHELYQNYTGCTYRGCADDVAAAPVFVPAPAQPAPRQEYVRQEAPKEKPRFANSSKSLVLADPFFQPESGRVGSLTDIGYAQNTYDFEILYGSGPWGNISGDWAATEMFIKEDLSIGITDNFALVGMIKYAKSEYEMNWEAPYGTDTMDDSGIAIWGLGGQWKFYENDDWIAQISAFFQSSDAANNIMLAGKVGYKATPDTTIYGLANLSYLMWEDNSYGNGVVSSQGQVAYIAFETDVSKSIYVEGGVGVFTNLSDQWSLDLEALFGSYSWHNQISAKAAIYWQPSDSFALGLYGRASVWDSADSAEDIWIYSWCDGAGTQCYTDFVAAPPAWYPAGWNPMDPYCMGAVSIEKYQDIQVGLHAIIYF